MKPSTGFPALGGPCMRAGYYNPQARSCRSLIGGDGGWGPLRVGIHGVGSGGDGTSAGAGYYGSMDLGGNLTEQVVTIGHPQGRAFRGTHGGGRLDPQGQATNSDWRPTADTSYFAHRGGSWVRHPNHGRVADRGFGLVNGGALRLPTRSFRAVRTTRSNPATTPRPDLAYPLFGPGLRLFSSLLHLRCLDFFSFSGFLQSASLPHLRPPSRRAPTAM